MKTGHWCVRLNSVTPRFMTQQIRNLCRELADDLGSWIEYNGVPSTLPVELSRTMQLLKRARLELARTDILPGDQPESRLKQLEDDMRLLGERYAQIEQNIAMINLELEARKVQVEGDELSVFSMVEEVDLAIARAPMSFEVTDAFAARDAIRAVASSLRKKGPTWAQESMAEAFADFIEQQAVE